MANHPSDGEPSSGSSRGHCGIHGHSPRAASRYPPAQPSGSASAEGTTQPTALQGHPALLRPGLQPSSVAQSHLYYLTRSDREEPGRDNMP